MTILSETRERLLRVIVAQVPPDRIAEIHFFAPIKQGGVESGVAVIAAAATAIPLPTDDSVESSDDSAESSEGPELPEAPAERHVIYTARYRLTLKGPDRGKWETNVVAEADAPLITVETVVRGVQRRVGDVEEPDRMTGDEVRAITDAWTAAALPGRPAAG